MTNNSLEEQKTAVRQWFTAFNNHDLETVQRLTAPAYYQQTLVMLTWNIPLHLEKLGLKMTVSA